jgi:hypothetical protein
VIDHEKHRWDDMRRGLDPEHRRAFDAVFQRARRHASAAGNQGALDPLDAILMTVLVEMEAEVQRLLARVAWLEADAEKPRATRRERHPHEEPIYIHSSNGHAHEDPVEEEWEQERPETVDTGLPA